MKLLEILKNIKKFQEMSIGTQFCYPRVALGMRVADAAHVANDCPNSDKGLQKLLFSPNLKLILILAPFSFPPPRLSLAFLLPLVFLSVTHLPSHLNYLQLQSHILSFTFLTYFCLEQ